MEKLISLGDNTQANVYDVGNNIVRKDFRLNNQKIHQNSIGQYKKLLNKKLKFFVTVYKIEDLSIFMEKLDTKSKEIYKIKNVESIIFIWFNECLDYFLNFNTGEHQKYGNFIKNCDSDKIEEVLKFQEFIDGLKLEAKKFNLIVNDLHPNQFGLDKHGQIKMFDWYHPNYE
mgnify:CR=1 FL=1